MHLARTIEVMTGSYAAEVFFLRLPESSEVEHVRAALEKEGALSGAHEYPLPDDLGVIYFNTSQPGQLVVDGFPRVPRLAQARVAVENGEPVRQIAVRMPYFDSRGNQFLATEARYRATGRRARPDHGADIWCTRRLEGVDTGPRGRISAQGSTAR